MLTELVSYAEELAAGFVSVWFLAWAIRRRYELDDPLTRSEKIVRWSIVALGFGLCFLQGEEYKAVRILAAIIAMIFLAWPAFARGILKLVRLHR